MNYSLQTLWHERSRFLPGILAVAFSAVLIALQCGLLLGLFSITSIPIDHTRADVWVGSPEVLSVDLGQPIPLSYMSRIAQDPRVANVEAYYQAFRYWTKPAKSAWPSANGENGGSELCIVIGCDLNPDSLGAVAELTPQMKVLLTQPGSVIVDEGELGRLGVTGIGDKAKIHDQSVQIVGLVKNLKSIAGPYVFCSRETARMVLRGLMPSDSTTYFLVKCRSAADAPALVADLNSKYPDMPSFTSVDFSLHSRKHWLFKTKAGIALGYAALLGLLVGMVVTSQTLIAATHASNREFAILLALGIPRWRISLTVLVQSFWVGVIGILVAYPTVNGLATIAEKSSDVKVWLRWYVLVPAGIITLVMAMISGLLALRSVRRIEPMSLLR